MVRKKSQNKHPVLLTEPMKDVLTAQENREMASIEGFHYFSRDKKMAVLLLPFFDTKQDLLKFMGKYSNWFVHHQASDPTFKQAVQAREAKQLSDEVILKDYARAISIRSIFRLEDIVENGKDRDAVDVIKYLHRMTDMQPKEEQAQQSVFVNVGNITMFNKDATNNKPPSSQSLRKQWQSPTWPDIVEGEARVINNDDSGVSESS
jgi:hypothetical protein